VINISTRAHVAPGQNTLIAGFVINGDSARRVLIRGVGPELNTRFGLAGALMAPQLTLFNGEGHVLQKAGAWHMQSNADEIRDASGRAGAFALAENGEDSAMTVTLVPGVYTVQVAGANDASGIALIEVYDLP
jgi:hypothetical protein